MAGETVTSTLRVPAATHAATFGAKHRRLRLTPVSGGGTEVLRIVDVHAGTGNASATIGSMAVGFGGAVWRGSRGLTKKSGKPRGSIALKALDQSSRYADLSLTEEQLIQQGQHVLVAYIMKPKAGYDYLATAAHFAAESSTGTNVNVCTTDDFTKSVDALVYYIDPENEEMKIAYPNLLFDRNITDGRAMMCSVLTLSIGNNQGMGDVEYGKIYDIYFPPQFLRLFDGPSCSVIDMWRILGRGTSDGGLVVGTIIKPKLGLQPKPFGEACYAFWLGGDFIKNDEPQGNQVFCQMSECIPEVVKAMRAAQKEAGCSKLFSANITADDPAEMIARGKYVLSQFGPLAENCAFLVDGYVAGGTAVTVARRNFPKQFLHYHRAGHGAVTSPQTQRGYTAFVHTKLSRVIGASGIHVGTMSFGKMEGDASDKNIAFMLQDDIADGPYYKQEWEGMIQTTPIISGGMNALRLPAFFENLGHSNVILTAGGGAFGHKDGPKQGATSCRQGEEAWKHWKAGLFGDISLSDGVIEYAKTHEEMKGAFLTFQKDADQIYPGWKEKLGYTGESSVQAASFDWQKKSAAAAFAGTVSSPERTVVACKAAGNHTMAAAQDGPTYQKPGNQELDFINDVGYLPDGSSLKTCGNNYFRPQSVDPHVDGSPLPKSYYVNDVGYLPDGTSLKTAGNNVFRPGCVDPHVAGSPLTPPLKGFCNSVGYLPDGTALELAGNLRNKLSPPVAGTVAPPIQTAKEAADGQVLAFQHATRAYFALDLLTSKGPRKNPDVGNPADATRPLGKVGPVSAGSWSCTDGGWDSPARRATSEVFYVWSGSGCVTDVDGTKHPFGPGDTVVLPKNWSGRWDVYATIHKVWFVHDHPDFHQPEPIRAVIAPRTAYDSMQKVYQAANMSVGSWTRSTGSFEEVRQTTEWLHVLEGVFFMTNSDGSAKRVVAGDTVLTPKGWRGMLDVLEPVKGVCVEAA